MRKILYLLAMAMLLVINSFAQSRTVTGTVTDENGNPIPNASVQVKGSSRGTVTDLKGAFSLSVPESAKSVIISFVNYQQITVPISGKPLSISLKPASTSLQEVVVVAYGEQKKTDITGAISTVKGGEVENKPFTSVDKALQGEVPGLQSVAASGAPGSAQDIRIRGIGSISAGSNPLWVIDGVIVTTNDLTTETTTANPLSQLNPDDIESISVLKDAASASVYGARAANGVILVTTKKGRMGKTRINFSTELGQNSYAYQNKNNRPMTADQYFDLTRTGLINAGYATDTASANAIMTSDFDYGNGVNTNWLNVVSQKGGQEQYNLSLSGGTDKTSVYASGGYFHQTGTTIATDFKRWNGDISVVHKANDWFTLSTTLSGGYSNQHTPTNGGTFANPVLAAFFLLPSLAPYNKDGTISYNNSDFSPDGVSSTFNPVAEAALNKNNTGSLNLRGNVEGDINFLKNLQFTSRFGAEFLDLEENQYFNPIYGDGTAYDGYASSSYGRVFNWIWTNTLDYTQALNKAKDINLDVKVGYESNLYKYYNLAATNTVLPDVLSLTYAGVGASPTAAYALPSGYSVASEFGIANINIKDKYILSGSVRRDGSSKFGANYQYGNFYSVGAAWNVNDEDFLKDSRVISLLKLRTSYGINGNSSGIGDYTALSTYGYGSDPYITEPGSFHYNQGPGSGPNSLGNPNLTWEKNLPFNIGVDFGLLKNRILGTVEYYNRTTKDLLVQVPLPPTGGFPYQNENIGSMVNKGLELSLSGTPILTKDFSWTISGNLSHNVNKVTKLYQGQAIPNGLFQITQGHDIQEYYLRQWAGVDPSNGSPLWYTDGTGKTTTSNFNEANPELNKSASPKYFGSVTNTFTYKGFDLSFMFYYNYGNYIFDTWAYYLQSDGLEYPFNELSVETTAWTTPGQKTNVPQFIVGNPSNSNGNSTRFLYNGDYIRLRNLEFGYSIPKRLTSKLHINNLNFYVRGTNLWTIVKDKNLPYDPEQGIASSTNLEVFIPKTISAGLKLGF
jgi:TonB-linked SusC/RagA family outer membrane protein